MSYCESAKEGLLRTYGSANPLIMSPTSHIIGWQDGVLSMMYSPCQVSRNLESDKRIPILCMIIG